MNDKQKKRSESIAAGVMRVFAVIGLISILALAAWIVVQGARFAPEVGEKLGAAVTTVTSVFSRTPGASLTFDVAQRTVSSGDVVTVGYEYRGDVIPLSYDFSYACDTSVILSMKSGDEWSSLPCATGVAVSGDQVQFIPVSDDKRLTSLAITISGGDITDTTILTVVNTNVASTTEDGDIVLDETALDDASAQDSGSPDNVDNDMVSSDIASTESTATRQSTYVVSTPVDRTPADLMVTIKQTGVLVPVAGDNTFFELSPIPSDRTAAVRFTVTNEGGQHSGAWAFVANLPVRGDEEYRYVSPAQASLAPNMEVEFTLGFDEVLDASVGTVRIEIFPTNTVDPVGNNLDMVNITID